MSTSATGREGSRRVGSGSIPRVISTPEAEELIDRLRRMHGPLMFHQSGQCCDGSQPMCFAEGDFRTGSSDVCLGEVYGCRFFVSRDGYEYWRHSQLIVDVTPGRGSSISLEIPLGVRFLSRGRVFTQQELSELEMARTGGPD